ncbi:undecaprenyl-diphosphate phosphatase [Tsukamurella sp. 8F]|uniref:undecaprenyl-diphosphate phosphatase n=1 Tax=unclassified Tsukamurella TaxID=2633480 RepID=UPI0023B9C985|nr:MULTISPECIES: undecaprenyl-diphosphate phosphatase [unclassified Tsukamurella]MDF0530517.1 undecaprenyl-diphosphate phosphatase [Tsukamurella sp. 8J]MDF0586833.1 undecaprenyl-diphosphate phosphatase [Tsukamurella sp. 8F]
MTWLQAVVLGFVQGLTEFLPVSSSGHLRIVSAIWFGDDAGASFTAVTQLGTEAAVLVYFFTKIVQIVRAWFIGMSNVIRGMIRKEPAGDQGLDYRMGWYVIIGTIPIGVLGLLFKDQIRSGARNLWLTASMLILFSLVILLAEKFATQRRAMDEMTARDAVIMGLAQCLALVPGVSRSGATSSAGLFLGLERRAAVELSFLLAIPAVTASGLFSLPDAFTSDGVGLQASGPQLLVATVIAFVVGYASVAWLLNFVAKHSLNWFVGYRIALGVIVLGLLTTGVVSAT